MTKYTGNPVGGGLVQGPALVLKKKEPSILKQEAENPELEIKRVEHAAALAKKQIQRLYDKAVTEAGVESAAIFEVHQMMLEDADLLDAINHTIRTEMVNAEYAAATAGKALSDMFASMDDEYMKARSIDVKDITERLVNNLIGVREQLFRIEEAAVMIADDLTPSETIQLDKDKVLALVTVHGSTNSHTAILAKMMNIPAVVAVPLNIEDIPAGITVTVDGTRGEVIVR